jgi:hypothetical protein
VAYAWQRKSDTYSVSNSPREKNAANGTGILTQYAARTHKKTPTALRVSSSHPRQACMLPPTCSPEHVDLCLLQHNASDGLHGDAIATVLCYCYTVFIFPW